MKKLFVYLFLIFNYQFLIAQWDTVAIIESNAFAHSKGWTGSINGSPWDCSDASIQKNPAAGDFVYVPEMLETGYFYRYTYYVKAREPQVFCEFIEGPEISAGGQGIRIFLSGVKPNLPAVRQVGHDNLSAFWRK